MSRSIIRTCHFPTRHHTRRHKRVCLLCGGYPFWGWFKVNHWEHPQVVGVPYFKTHNHAQIHWARGSKLAPTRMRGLCRSDKGRWASCMKAKAGHFCVGCVASHYIKSPRRSFTQWRKILFLSVTLLKRRPSIEQRQPLGLCEKVLAWP